MSGLWLRHWAKDRPALSELESGHRASPRPYQPPSGPYPSRPQLASQLVPEILVEWNPKRFPKKPMKDVQSAGVESSLTMVAPDGTKLAALAWSSSGIGPKVEINFLRYKTKTGFGGFTICVYAVSEYLDFAGGFVDQRTDDADSRRFASAIRSQQGVEITGLDV